MRFFGFFKKWRSSAGAIKSQPQIFSREEVIKEQRRQMIAPALNATTDKDDEVAKLNRKATSLANLGRMDDAVDCLMRVVELSEAQIQNHPTDGIRLALYLQKAGRGYEAIKEMDRLMAMVPYAVDACLTHGKPSPSIDKASFEADQYATLFDKLRLIMHREGMKLQSDLYRQQAIQWRDRASALYKRHVMKMLVDVPARPILKKIA